MNAYVPGRRCDVCGAESPRVAVCGACEASERAAVEIDELRARLARVEALPAKWRASSRKWNALGCASDLETTLLRGVPWVWPWACGYCGSKHLTRDDALTHQRAQHAAEAAASEAERPPIGPMPHCAGCHKPLSQCDGLASCHGIDKAHRLSRA